MKHLPKLILERKKNLQEIFKHQKYRDIVANVSSAALETAYDLEAEILLLQEIHREHTTETEQVYLCSYKVHSRY
jgi:hypothetical protein